MNAKEARPVDDPKALVPFGWAPGGYHCAACSTCGEAHSGSDKRSMRCQDCAEALRDKRANEPTPTTRETADHADLARTLRVKAHIENLKCRPGHHVQFGTPSVVQVPNYWNRDLASDLEALLSEIAALRGDLAKTERDYSELRDSYDAVAAKLTIERSHGTKQFARATQAERQHDELRKALEPFALLAPGYGKSPINMGDPLSKWLTVSQLVDAAEAHANQGADQ